MRLVTPIRFCTWWPTSCAIRQGLGKVARARRAAAQGLEEAEVDVDHGRLGRRDRLRPAPAGRGRGVVEEHERGALVVLAARL